MRKVLSCILILVLCFSFPAAVFADSDYSRISNKGVALEYPAAEYYYAVPQSAEVKASRANGSIYFMPTPKDGNGVLGTVASGTKVTLLAEKSGFYFFSTEDGRKGWNGKIFFTVLSIAWDSPAWESGVFTFDSGANVTIPSSFYTTGTDRNNSRVVFSFTDFDQDMDLALTEFDTSMSGQRSSVFINNLYSSLKRDYPKPTYDNKKADQFDLSGYMGDYIYYVYGACFGQAVYMIEMYYPTKNRNICDRYVERITASFTASPVNTPWCIPAPCPTTVRIPRYPTSSYGIALKYNIENGVFYTDQEKKDIVNETYYSRKDARGNHRPWYTSSAYDDPNTGYRIGFYYADGLVFFADAYHVGQRLAVTFYFWGNQLLCVHDLRNGDKQMRFPGSATYNAVVREFGDLYAVALQCA